MNAKLKQELEDAVFFLRAPIIPGQKGWDIEERALVEADRDLWADYITEILREDRATVTAVKKLIEILLGPRDDMEAGGWSDKAVQAGVEDRLIWAGRLTGVIANEKCPKCKSKLQENGGCGECGHSVDSVDGSECPVCGWTVWNKDQDWCFGCGYRKVEAV